MRFILRKIKRFFNLLSLNVKGHRIAYSCVISSTNLGKSATIEDNTRIIGASSIKIGNNFYCNCDCHFLGNIEIGNDVLIGPKVIIWSRNHNYKLDTPIRTQGHTDKPIKIGDNLWIGSGVIILPGVEIESGSIIAAGSVVTKNVTKNLIVGGNPVKILKERK